MTRKIARIAVRRRRRLLHQLKFKQFGQCFYCQRRFVMYVPGHPLTPTIDHMLPRSAGGATDAGNCVAACLTCNQAKGDLAVGDFVAVMASFKQDHSQVCNARGLAA
jgi:5-methylcytosine-specific restriction endonuclease McrA